MVSIYGLGPLGWQLAVVTSPRLRGQNEIVYISPETEALGPRTGASCKEDRAKFVASRDKNRDKRGFVNQDIKLRLKVYP